MALYQTYSLLQSLQSTGKGGMGVRFCVTQHRKSAPCVTQKRFPLPRRRLLRAVNMASAACARFLLQRSTHGFLFSSRATPSLTRSAGSHILILNHMVQIHTFGAIVSCSDISPLFPDADPGRDVIEIVHCIYEISGQC